MPPAVVLHPSRVSGLFVSGSTLQLVKLGQVIKVEPPKPETSSDEEGLTFEPEDYKLVQCSCVWGHWPDGERST